MMQLTIADNLDSLQEALARLAGEGKRLALVPTMGALHAGHMALIKQAKQHADAVMVSIFVNPKQFGPNEDFAKYPRSFEADMRKVEQSGGAIVYAPPVGDLYPEGFSTSVSAGEISTILCGRSRPGHFDGVATVVTKLLLRTLPHAALFGQKDYQQLCVIRRVVDDLDIPVEIIGAPTVREADGLAMSSRNAYLTADERILAPLLYEVLNAVSKAIISQAVTVKLALEQGIAALGKSGFKVDYLELREAETLASLESLDAPARLLAAAWLGQTRLIDNIAVEAA